MRGRREAGQVLPLIALSLAVLMGFAGVGVDIGYWQYQQHEQQSATDAAALGAAQQLIYAGCGNASAAQTAAYTDSASNGFTNGTNGITVTVTNPPSSGPYAGNTCAVDVKTQATNVPRFFTRFVSKLSNISETTEAVATLVNDSNGCIFLLQQNLNLQLNGTNINSPNCGITANSSLVQTNGGTITVGAFGYAHSLQDNSTSFTKASPQKIQPVADPCPEIPGCAYLAANAPPMSTCTQFQNNGANKSVTPGCYSLFQLSGGTVTMSPGQYIFTGPVQDNGATVIGNGVSMYVTSTGGPVQFNGASDTFSPPTSGNDAGVLLYQSPSNNSVVQFNGGSVSMSGLVYAPTALGQVNGNDGSYLVLVFGDMQFNGSSTIDLGGPVLGSSLIRNAVLAQ